MEQAIEDASHEGKRQKGKAKGEHPTKHFVAHGRHLRVAVGRDYADVPPTRGVLRGSAESKLDVGVQVTLAERPAPQEELIPTTGWTPPEDSSNDQQQQ